MTTTFLQGICSSWKSTEIADDKKIVSLGEQAARGGWQLWEWHPRPAAPRGAGASFHQHKGGRVSMKSTLSTAHPA